MADTIIRVEHLCKKYVIGHQKQEQHTALRDVITSGVTSLGRKVFSHRNKDLSVPVNVEDFWALRDVSFEIKRGERVGIIGRNGAGKSTLLKILSRIVEPTTGRIYIKGRVASLLEVGTGFHPELTGRENIFLNGSILGMSKMEIHRKFDEIVEFAEVERFLDTPVKRYSSGMYVRLAFAVAAHLEPEILVVDEVLAVGDSLFQKKCLGKMEEVAEKEGRTVFFVSHNMEAIQELCQRCILLEGGNIRLDGSKDRVVYSYLTSQHESLKSSYKMIGESCGNEAGEACLVEAVILNSQGEVSQSLRFGEPFAIRMLWQNWSRLSAVSYSLRFFDSCNRFLFAVNSLNSDLEVEDPGTHVVICKFENNVCVPGKYYVSVGCYIRPDKTVHCVEPCLSLSVENMPFYSHKPFNVFGNPIFAPAAVWKSK